MNKEKNKTKNQIVFSALILVALLTGSLIGFTIAQTPTNTFYIEGSNYPGAPTYTIFTEGGYTYAKNAYGYIASSSTTDDVPINYALAQLNGIGGSVFIKTGEYTITATITVYNNTRLYGEAIDDYISQGYGSRFNADSSLTDPVIENAGSACINIVIEQLVIDGNKPDSTEVVGAHGVHFTSAVRCKLIDLSIYNCKDTGIYFDGSGSIENEFHRCKSRGNNDDGLYLTVNSDFKIYSGEYGSNIGDGVTFSSCSHGLLTGANIFLNDRGVMMYNVRYTRVISNRINTNDQHGVYVLSASTTWGVYNIISDNDIYDNGYTTASCAGIYLNTNAPNEVQYNIISDNVIYDSAGNYQDYGIRSINDCDYNAYLDNICVDADTMNIQIAGANSEVHSCFNGTSWIT